MTKSLFLRLALLISGLILSVSGCGSKANPVAPGTTMGDFPPDTKFSVTLYSPSLSVAVGGTFDVRVVLYNVSEVSAVALRVTYPVSNVEVLAVAGDTTFFPPDSVVSLSHIEPDSGRIEYGVSFKNSSLGKSKTGSGLVCTFKCKAQAAGTATFVIDRSTLQVITPNGTLIDDFATLLVENLTIAIH